jgi:hypothetical protein
MKALLTLGNFSKASGVLSSSPPVKMIYTSASAVATGLSQNPFI